MLTKSLVLRSLTLSSVFGLLACGGSSNTAGSGGATASGSGGAGTVTSTTTGPSSGSTNPKGDAYSIDFGKVSLMPGEEDTKCVVKRLSNTEAMHVGNIHNTLSSASHHLIVYRVADTEERAEPYPCQPFADLLQPDKGTPLMITQKHDDLLALPKGVGFEFAAGQMVRLEMHYLNASNAPIDATATSTFYAMPEADVTAKADLLFVGNPDITIPPMSKHTLGPTYLPLPATLSGANFFGVTGHTHRFGTKVTVATAAEEGGKESPVYDVQDWLWGEPETVYHDPPFQVPDGGGFQFTCAWNNTSDKKVGFGESATDEMCFFWTYYYPSKGAFVCVHTDQVPGGIDLCCPGSPVCSELFK